MTGVAETVGETEPRDLSSLRRLEDVALGGAAQPLAFRASRVRIAAQRVVFHVDLTVPTWASDFDLLPAFVSGCVRETLSTEGVDKPWGNAGMSSLSGCRAGLAGEAAKS